MNHRVNIFSKALSTDQLLLTLCLRYKNLYGFAEMEVSTLRRVCPVKAPDSTVVMPQHLKPHCHSGSRILCSFPP